MASPTRGERETAGPTLKEGMLMGFRFPPGGKLSGEYLVADLEEFGGLSFNNGAGNIQKVQTHT